MELASNAQFYVAQALWESKTRTGQQIIEKWRKTGLVKEIERITNTPPVDLKTIDITSPAMLDMLWATFMASGDTQYVERIVGVLAYPVDGEEQEERMNNILLAGSAKWSLSSNAFQHGLVYETCKKYAASENTKLREAILEILASADEAQAEQNTAH